MKTERTERTAEDWGRVAVSLPGWRWMSGMTYVYADDPEGSWSNEDPDDDACGCGVHWMVQDLTRYPRWHTPPIQKTYPDEWTCHRSPVLHGGRLQDPPESLFNPFGFGGMDDPESVVTSTPGAFPDPDDPATAGCLLALVQGAIDVSFQCSAWWTTYNVRCSRLTVGMTGDGDKWEVRAHGHDPHHNAGWSKPVATGSSLGRACIAAAAALGRWPGGEG